MSTIYLPEGYTTVTPFMIVEGADDLIAFLETTFGATKKEYMTGSDDSVKHAETHIGDSLVMIADPREPETKANTTMLYVYAPDVDATYAKAMEGGATSIREPHDSLSRSAGSSTATARAACWTASATSGAWPRTSRMFRRKKPNADSKKWRTEP